jgi:DNA-binding beta-propeller fold protein YncE
LWRLGDFGFWEFSTSCLSVNPTDGSCWVADAVAGAVVRLAPDGMELVRVADIDRPGSVSVNPTDGSCWVAAPGEDWPPWPYPVPGGETGYVLHLAADGTELWRGEGVTYPVCVAVNPADGSCWVARIGETRGSLCDTEVVHLAEDGTELLRQWIDCLQSVAVNPVDGSCWVGSFGWLTHMAEDGTCLWEGGATHGGSLATFSAVSVNPSDGSCWLADPEGPLVLRVAEDGSELWCAEGYDNPTCVSVNPTDGSCWMVDDHHSGSKRALLHLAENGVELSRRLGVGHVVSIAVNSADGSCWMADRGEPEVAHFAEDGTKLWRSYEWDRPLAVSVSPSDGSCWMIDGGEVIRLAEDGAKLWRVGGGLKSVSLSVDPTDNSCWVAGHDSLGYAMVRVAEDGTEGLRVRGIDRPVSVSVNPTDGSCWVAAPGAEWGPWWDPHYGPGYVVHLAADGAELSRAGDFSEVRSVSANPADGSCWAASGDEVAHLAEDGTERWRGAGFAEARSVSVNPTDGSCWVACEGSVVHLALAPPTFRDIPYYHWAVHEIEACAAAEIIGGYADGLYRPALAVRRDQMAVFMSRALAGGDANVPDGPAEATFRDVSRNHWAFRHVEHCVAQGVVQGAMPRLYHPQDEVDRAQMAVYIARALVAPEGEAALAEYTPADPRDFPDVPSDHCACTHIEYCVENGVVQGYEDGCYHPEIVVTRDQMAVYMCRAFGLSG